MSKEQTSLSIDKEIKAKAEKKAKEIHLSLSGVARILLADFADGKITIGTIVADRDEDGFSPAESKAILDAAREALEGKNVSKSFSSAEELIQELKS